MENPINIFARLDMKSKNACATLDMTISQSQKIVYNLSDLAWVIKQ